MDDWVVDVVKQENDACNDILIEIRACIDQESPISLDLSLRQVETIENIDLQFIDQSPSKMAQAFSHQRVQECVEKGLDLERIQKVVAAIEGLSAGEEGIDVGLVRDFFLNALVSINQIITSETTRKRIPSPMEKQHFLLAHKQISPKSNQRARVSLLKSNPLSKIEWRQLCTFLILLRSSKLGMSAYPA